MKEVKAKDHYWRSVYTKWPEKAVTETERDQWLPGTEGVKGKWGMTSPEYRVSLRNNEIRLSWWWLHNSVNILKTTELNSLNG